MAWWNNWMVEVSDDSGNHVVIDNLSKTEASQVVKTLRNELGSVADDSERYTTDYYGSGNYDRNSDPGQFKHSSSPIYSGDENLEDSHDRELDNAQDPDEVLAESSGGFKWLPW